MAKIENAVDVSLLGVVYGMSAALPVFRRPGSGHFVQIGSVSGRAGGVPGPVRPVAGPATTPVPG